MFVVGLLRGAEAVPDGFKREGLTSQNGGDSRGRIKQPQIFARSACAVGLPKAASFQRGDTGPIQAMDRIAELAASGADFGLAHPVEHSLIGLLNLPCGFDPQPQTLAAHVAESPREQQSTRNRDQEPFDQGTEPGGPGAEGGHAAEHAIQPGEDLGEQFLPKRCVVRGPELALREDGIRVAARLVEVRRCGGRLQVSDVGIEMRFGAAHQGCSIGGGESFGGIKRAAEPVVVDVDRLAGTEGNTFVGANS